MGVPITSSQYARFLDKRVTDVVESRKQYNMQHAMIQKLFNVMGSDSAWEEYDQVGAVPDIPEFNGKLSTLSVSPGFHTKITHKEHAGKLQIERKFWDDRKWPIFEDAGAGLEDAAERTREKDAVNVFTNSNSVAFDFMESEEGVALSSNSHTTKSGTSTSTGFDNAGTSAMSKTSVAATWILMRQFKNDISEVIEPDNSVALVYPINLNDLAEEIAGTPKGLDDAHGNINPQFRRYELIPYPRLDQSDSNNWHMVNKTLMKKSLLWLDRIRESVKTHVDFQTYMTEISLYYRASYGWRDWRWVYSQVVS